MIRISLHSARIQPEGLHRREDPVAQLVDSHATQQQGIRAQASQVPGHIERGSTQDLAAVREAIEQHFAEDDGPPAVAHCNHSLVSGQ